jgi:peroxiredoxin
MLAIHSMRLHALSSIATAMAVTACLFTTAACGGGGTDAATPSAEKRVGNPAADFTLTTKDGGKVTLSSLKNKVVLVDFWATWCEPCKVEIPAFVDFQEKYGKNGLQMVGISIDDTPGQLEPYVKGMKMNYPVLVGKDRDDVQDAFGPLVGIPVTVVISRDGKVCASHAGLTGKDAFEREIKALL